MKIRLNISEDKFDEVKDKLVKAGFEVDDNGEFVLTEAEGRSAWIEAKDPAGQKMRIAVEKIIYIESFGHEVEVHTTEGLYYAKDRLYQLDEMLDQVVTAHLHDNMGINDEHLLPGEGRANWPHIVERLRRAPRLVSLQSEVMAKYYGDDPGSQAERFRKFGFTI